MTLWTEARQAPLSMESSRQEYWCGLPFPSPGDFLNTATGATLLFCSKLCRAFSSQSKSTNLQNNLKSLMRSDLPLVISLILTPITSSCAQHTQETLASFPFPECSRHMLLPWNIYHAAPFLKNMFLSHISTYLFSHLFQVLVICFHLDLSVSY